MKTLMLMLGTALLTFALDLLKDLVKDAVKDFLKDMRSNAGPGPCAPNALGTPGPFGARA